MKKCLVIGAAMLDISMHINRLPKSGEDVYAENQEIKVGGCAFNVADILRHFRIPYTLFAPIGTGMYADLITDNLKKSGQASPIHSTKMDNGYCLSLVEPDGERTFITLPGIECSFEKEWFDGLETNSFDSAYVCGYEIEGAGGNTIIRFLEQNPKYTVYYAPGPRITYISQEKQRRIFAMHPVIHLNDKEALNYTGKQTIEEASKYLSDQTHNTVIVTLGAKGVFLQENDTFKIITSEPVKAVDSTGAGDSHIGTIIAQLKSGKTFEQSVKIANRVSALVVGVNGPVLSDREFTSGGFYNESFCR